MTADRLRPVAGLVALAVLVLGGAWTFLGGSAAAAVGGGAGPGPADAGTTAAAADQAAVVEAGRSLYVANCAA